MGEEAARIEVLVPVSVMKLSAFASARCMIVFVSSALEAVEYMNDYGFNNWDIGSWPMGWSGGCLTLLWTCGSMVC